MYLALATGHGHVNETAGVQDALVGAALRGLLLLLGLDLYSVVGLEGRLRVRTPLKGDSGELGGQRGTCLRSGRLDLTGTGKRTVNLTHVG